MSAIASGALFRFATVGLLTFTTCLLFTALFHEVFHLAPTLSFAIALGLTFCLNFLAARHYIFRASSGPLLNQFFAFTSVSLSFRLAEWLAYLCLQTLALLPYLPGAALVLITSFGAKFIIFRRYIFK